MKITLETHEIHLAASAGVQRTVDHFAQSRPETFYATKKIGRWENDIQSAAAEVAFAKVTGMYWNGSYNTFKAGGDVGIVQVRSSSREDARLIIRPADRAEDIFVLMTGEIPTFTYHGWIRAKEARANPEWQDSPNGDDVAFFVPQEALKKNIGG